VDTSKISLADLRTRLAIVPQDPTLLIGTIRSNLDRYITFSDSELWEVLESVGLKKYVEGLPGQLHAPIQESGLNLSQGQRQLLCLARALLVKAQLVLMDEATASVDIESDYNIQKVLREKFSGVTILMIAHRLSTLEDCHLILKIEDGYSSQLSLDAVGSDTLT
jgi:ABC-type multidrug transport system fused ATPase/permease subunit